jgi:hypothetical protein
MMSPNLPGHVVPAKHRGHGLAYAFVDEGTPRNQAETHSVIQHSKSSAHERDGSRVHTGNGLPVSDRVMHRAAVSFDRACRLFYVAGSKGREEIPHWDYALTASFRKSLLHEKHFPRLLGPSRSGACHDMDTPALRASGCVIEGWFCVCHKTGRGQHGDHCGDCANRLGYGFSRRRVKIRAGGPRSAVKEQLQLHDPQTDIARALERQRVLLALRGCLAESARQQGDKAFHSRCLTIDTSVILGIKRSELVAALGPPPGANDSILPNISVVSETTARLNKIQYGHLSPHRTRQADSCVSPTRVSSARV